MSQRGQLDDIPAKKPHDELAAKEFNTLVAAVRRSLNITGPLVVTDSSGTYIGLPRPKVEEKRWKGRVMAFTVVDPNQWTYTVREQRKGSPGYGGWVDKDEKNPRDVECFNEPEDGNSDSGVQGTGINQDNLTGDFAHQPIPVGSIVEVTEVRLPAAPGGPGGPGKSETVEYWIDRMNGVDGRCGSAPPPPPPPPPGGIGEI